MVSSWIEVLHTLAPVFNLWTIRAYVVVKVFGNGASGGGGGSKDPPCRHCHPVTGLIPSLSEDIVVGHSPLDLQLSDRSGLLPPQKKVQTCGAVKGLNGGERRVRQTARPRSPVIVLTLPIASAILGTGDISISVTVLSTSVRSKQYKGFSRIGDLIEDLRLYLTTCQHSCCPSPVHVDCEYITTNELQVINRFVSKEF